MTARGSSERWTYAACGGLARPPVRTVPTISAGAPTSHRGPILAPAATAASHIDIQARLWYNRCKSEVVGHAKRGNDDHGRVGQQSILCKAVCGPNKPDHFRHHSALHSAPGMVHTQ
jgi:hypothetical protein